jgi:hypothetical protein
MQTVTVSTVYVDINRHGGWEVLPPDASQPIGCETLDAARRAAHRCAERSRPCGVVVRDAYHRVSQRELIDDPVAP